eukprot:6958971-Prymnesium_polylepis.1
MMKYYRDPGRGAIVSVNQARLNCISLPAGKALNGFGRDSFDLLPRHLSTGRTGLERFGSKGMALMVPVECGTIR